MIPSQFAEYIVKNSEVGDDGCVLLVMQGLLTSLPAVVAEKSQVKIRYKVISLVVVKPADKSKRFFLKVFPRW